MRQTHLKLFFISQGLGFIYFWISLAIPYLMYRGLTSVEVFSLMSMYQFICVLLEYPTGVIGDRFGYRRTLFIANTLNALSMVILAQSGGTWVYVIGLVILAVGSSFSSGNNLGLLKTVSTNIRRDTANLTAQAELVVFLSAIIGTWLGAISYELALYISAAAMFSANLPLLLLPSDGTHKVADHSLLEIIKDGFDALKTPSLAQIFLIVAVYGGFLYTTKSIVGSFASLYNFDLKLIGIIIGLSALFSAAGSKLYAYSQSVTNFHILLLLTLLVIISSQTQMFFTAMILLGFHFAAGYLFAAIDGDIHELALDHTRSSLFSLKRLVMRLVSSGYLLIYGVFIGRNQFSLLMLCLGAIMLITVWVTRQYSSYTKRATI